MANDEIHFVHRGGSAVQHHVKWPAFAFGRINSGRNGDGVGLHRTVNGRFVSINRSADSIEPRLVVLVFQPLFSEFNDFQRLFRVFRLEEFVVPHDPFNRFGKDIRVRSTARQARECIKTGFDFLGKFRWNRLGWYRCCERKEHEGDCRRFKETSR